MHVFPIASAMATVNAVVSGLVAVPEMISTSFITGTGFIKCIPTTFSGRLVADPIFVMEMEEVLEARIAFFGAISSSDWKIVCLSCGFSVAALKNDRESPKIRPPVEMQGSVNVAD